MQHDQLPQDLAGEVVAMSDAVLAALIGVGGSVVGAFAAVLAAHTQTARKSALRDEEERPGKQPVLGSAVDIRELHTLRALFGGPRGRYLEGYRDGYYAPYRMREDLSK
jgi:hypothetical protein